MTRATLFLISLALLPMTLQGCALAVGAGAAVVADEVMEQKNGDDGLF